MSGMDKNWVEELKSRLNIVSVISQYIHVNKSGGRYWACCPFHQEKTASFSIEEKKQFYYCYGCHRGGDVITFVMEYDKLSYPEAVESLAEKAGIKMPESIVSQDKDYMENKEKQKKAKLVNHEAMIFYHKCLNSDPKLEAFNYFTGRGLSPETIKAFGLGFSPDKYSLIDYLTKKGYSIDSMKNAELIEKRNGEFVDKMTGRYIVPILNDMKEVVAFGGRSINPTEAKYMNTRNSAVFDKGRNLFSLYNLKEYTKSGKNNDSAILVEGYMDVISLYENGIKNAVASMGTALTPDQCRQLEKYVNKVYVCYDGDLAGRAATLRNIELLGATNLEILVVSLPDGLDPDDTIKKFGKEEFLTLINKALPKADYLLYNVEKNQNLDTLSGRSKYAQAAVKVLNSLPDTEKEVYLEAVSEKSRITVDVLRQELKSSFLEKTAENNKPATKTNAYLSACRFILSSLLNETDYSNVNDISVDFFTDPTHINIARYIVESTLAGDKIIAGSVYSLFERTDETDATIMAYSEVNILASSGYYCDCLITIKNEYKKRRIEELKQKLFTSSDIERKKLFEEIDKITKMEI